MSSKHIVHIETIADLYRISSVSAPNHPLFGIIRLEDIPKLSKDYPERISYGFYTIGLKKNLNGYIRYGRGKYDFQEGLLGFTAPNQVLEFKSDITKNATGYLIFFDKLFISGNQKVGKIDAYHFFDYHINEALHLSHKEEMIVENILDGMYHEYNLPIDKYSKEVIVSSLELLCSYASRFYNRQFVTRNDVDSSFLVKFEQTLKQYFSSGMSSEQGIPSVGYFSEKLNLSPNYLSDLLRSLTGKSTQEHIHFQVLEKAKNLIQSTDKTIAEIAYEIGFEYPQYFSVFFKKKTGVTPTVFRNQRQ
ncbi:MAG: helix-turn-helix domain-containing protein [Bacteroidota bacterium]